MSPLSGNTSGEDIPNHYAPHKSPSVGSDIFKTSSSEIDFLPPILSPVMNKEGKIVFSEQNRQVESPQDYEYPLQRRIATEWANLLGEDFTTETNLVVFKDKIDQIYNIATSGQKIDREIILRKLANLKNGAVSIATSLKTDMARPIEVKLMEVLPIKYSPDAWTELRQQGYSEEYIRDLLKELYSNDETYQLQGFELSDDEISARLPRYPAFPDPYQDMSDTWQRAAKGTDLNKEPKLGIVIGEGIELLSEFNGMNRQQTNSLRNQRKIDAISLEIADVNISIDGEFSRLDADVGVWQNFALDRMIDTYGDVPKLRRLGVSTRYAMDYLSKCRRRDDEGFPRPIDKRIPELYHGPIFRITSKAPLEPNFSSEVIH